MYIFLGGLVSLMLFAMHQVLESRKVSVFYFNILTEESNCNQKRL